MPKFYNDQEKRFLQASPITLAQARGDAETVRFFWERECAAGRQGQAAQALLNGATLLLHECLSDFHEELTEEIKAVWVSQACQAWETAVANGADPSHPCFEIKHQLSRPADLPEAFLAHEGYLDVALLSPDQRAVWSATCEALLEVVRSSSWGKPGFAERDACERAIGLAMQSGAFAAAPSPPKPRF